METSNRLSLYSGKAQYVIFNAPGSNTDHDTAYHDGLSLLFFLVPSMQYRHSRDLG